MRTSPSRSLKVFLFSALCACALLMQSCVIPNCEKRGYKAGRTYNLSYPPGDANAISSTVADAAGFIHYPRPDRTGNCGSVKATLAGSGFSFFFSPFSVDLQAVPATFTITGGDFDTTYGMPLVEFTDNAGNTIAQTTATEMGSDGTWIQANTPDLSPFYTGTYEVRISNATADGTWYQISDTTVQMWNNDPPPPDPDINPCTFDGRDWICY